MSIYEKLRAVQLELNAPKGQYNSFGKYAYRSAEDILEAAKPVCASHDLTLVVGDEIVSVDGRWYVKATAVVFDDEGAHASACGWAREADDKKGMDASQLTGATSSYARKYAMGGLFAIDDSKDADTDEHAKQTGRESKPPAKKAAPKKAVAKKVAPKKAEDDSPPWDDAAESQRKRLLESMKAAGVPGAKLKEKVAELGYKSFGDVDSIDDLNTLNAWLEIGSWND